MFQTQKEGSKYPKYPELDVVVEAAMVFAASAEAPAADVARARTLDQVNRISVSILK
jgi:hypothetical protein